MKAVILIVLFGVVSAAVHRKIDQELNEAWEVYKSKYVKNYESDAKDLMRRSTWENNPKKIQQHNLRYDLNETTLTLGMDKYGDLTTSELVSMMNGFRESNASDTSDREVFVPPVDVHIPESVDWRKKGYATRVKDQGECGSCWAFSATGSFEGQWYHKTQKLVSFSEQNLVDCSLAEGNFGCNGGWMERAFEYIKKNGIETEKAYPYMAEDEHCEYNPKKKAAWVTGYKDIKARDEAALTAVIATIGPISVAIDASLDSFYLYKSGVYDRPHCSSKDLDHGVLAVGYGSDAGKKYYIVKNSWGADWGQKSKPCKKEQCLQFKIISGDS